MSDDETAEAEVLLPLHTEEDVRQKLQSFFDRHPYSSLTTHRIGDVELQAVEKPWGDTTLLTLIGPDYDALSEALNNTLLLERLSALWHIDTKDLEVIWTAYQLTSDQKEIADRKFNFIYEGRSYTCEFGTSSDRLLTLASTTLPRSNPSGTNFRNLSSFNSYMVKNAVDDVRKESLDEPRSFWIRNIDLSPTELIDFIIRLNFYMSYFDTRSPTVLIHSPESGGVQSKIRYNRSKFPETILSRNLDENLLSFWSAADRENEMLQFILYYRVIEYAAFHYMDAESKMKVKLLLSDPMCGQDVDATLESILDALDPIKSDDVPRFNALLGSAVNPDVIWNEIERNRGSFTNSTHFDGGYVLDKIMGAGETKETFAAGGVVKFADAIRKIRNVLAHGRDQRTAKVITPSLRNLKALRPWVNAIAAAAGEVVLYEAAT